MKARATLAAVPNRIDFDWEKAARARAIAYVIMTQKRRGIKQYVFKYSGFRVSVRFIAS